MQPRLKQSQIGSYALCVHFNRPVSPIFHPAGYILPPGKITSVVAKSDPLNATVNDRVKGRPGLGHSVRTNRPVFGQFFNKPRKCLKINGFLDKTVDTGFPGATFCVGIGHAGNCDNDRAR